MLVMSILMPQVYAADLWEATKDSVQGTFSKLGKSTESRFKNPGFDLRNNMLVGDSNDTNNALIPGAKNIDDKVNL